jgi:hypothetical protein
MLRIPTLLEYVDLSLYVPDPIMTDGQTLQRLLVNAVAEWMLVQADIAGR